MPKIVCSKCEVELQPKVNGVQVIEYAEFGPYKLWHADELECPVCGIRVSSGFGQKPIAVHHDDEFVDVLQQWLKYSKDHIRHDYENQRQRKVFELE